MSKLPSWYFYNYKDLKYVNFRKQVLEIYLNILKVKSIDACKFYLKTKWGNKSRSFDFQRDEIN